MVVCAGYVLATRNLWIGIAKLIYCFNVEYSAVHSLRALLPSPQFCLSAITMSISTRTVQNYNIVGGEEEDVGWGRVYVSSS